MLNNRRHDSGSGIEPTNSSFEWNLSRRSLLGAGALLGLAAITHPAERAFAWSSWTNATSPILKGIGMGDCVHEDLVQISYARMVRNHANDTSTDSFLNPWAGTIESDARYAKIAGDTVDIGEGQTFADADDLATRLFRENLAYLRIGSFWNDAAANVLADFGASCYWAESVPKFSGKDYYEGAWDVGQHIWETNEQNKKAKVVGLDALVQFTMNDRNNFIHGMLSSTASHSAHLKQSEVKKFALQWLGVAYEYARTGEVTATSDILPTYFNKNGQSYVCDAGRRGLHTPTFVMAPIRSMRRAYRRMGLSKNYDEVLAAAKSYDAWQRGSHLFYSGKYNTTQSKYVTSGHEGASIWADSEGESRLVELADKIHEGFTGLSSRKQAELLAQIGCNGCHNMVSAIGMVSGMLQEFSIDLRGSLRSSGDATMRKLEQARAFFESGLTGEDVRRTSESLSAASLFAAEKAYADEGDEDYATSNMAVEDFCHLDGGSYLIAVRDMDSLETSVMIVPANTPGKDKLEEEAIANLTITYTLQTEFEDDLDYDYLVTNIDYSNMEKGVYLLTGTVKKVSRREKTLTLDLNGISKFELALGDELPEIPEVGNYICARYSFGDARLDLVDYDELEKPGTLVKATYPVVKVAGSNLWLLTNGGDSDSKEGYPTYLQVYYGAADVRSVPREGYDATVYYYDEVYGDATGAGESGLADASTESTRVSAQAAENELTNSATPEYLELGDAYGSLDYGDEVFHVASVIIGMPEMPDESEPTEEEGKVSPKTPKSREAGSAKADNSNEKTSKASGDSTPKTGSTTSSSTATPKTDDPFTGLNGLLSLAALAGAGMAAYSARRVANERRNAEEE